MHTRAVKGIYGGFMLVCTTWLVGVGCLSSNDTPAPSTSDTSTTCPRSLSEAIGAACTLPNQDCPIGYYSCGSTPQQAHCTCTNGKFACVDSTGALVAKDTPPGCIGAGKANDKECPAAEKGTERKACTTAGLLCYYIGVQCPENQEPNVDTCQCVNTGNGALAFHCEPKGCNPRSDAGEDAFTVPVPDAAGTPDVQAGD